MPIEIRCYSCNKVIANKYESYLIYIKNGKTSKEALDILKLNRYCCRRMILSYVDLDTPMLIYSETEES